MYYVQGEPLRRFNKKFTALIATLAILINGLAASMPFVFNEIANAAGETINISTVAELRNAIENQDNDQVWNIQSGNYGLAPFTGITVEGQTGWYFPITANNLIINGIGSPTIYGTGFSLNGNWSTQNFVSVFGDGVTIDGVKLQPKIQPNKTIEVLGSNFTLRNTTIEPNTLADPAEYNGISDDYKQWGGSLYFSHEGNHTVQNVNIKNSGISFRYSPSGTNITFDNVDLTYETNVTWINGYRYSSGFNNLGNTTTGTIDVSYHVNEMLNNLDQVLNYVQNEDTVQLDSNLTTTKQITLDNNITFNGNNHIINAAFTKTDNDNNSAIGVLSDGVTINNVTVDGFNGINLHGINVYESTNVVIDTVTAKNFRSGIALNSSVATLRNITTMGNIWHGINVDTRTAQLAGLTIENTSSHAENSPAPPSGFIDGTHVSHIFIDDATDGSTVTDINNQYDVAEVDFRGGRALVYTLKAPNTAPIVSFTSPTPTEGSIVTGTITPRVLATDDYGMGSYYIRLWKGAFESGLPNLVSNNCSSAPGAFLLGTNLDITCPSIDTTTLTDGTYVLSAQFLDGHIVWGQALRTFTVDNTAPELPVHESPANNISINYNDFWFEWSDSLGAVSYETQYSQNPATGVDGAFTNVQWSGDYQNIQPTDSKARSVGANGTWYWQVRAVDSSGLKSAWTSPWKITIDMVAPAVPTNLRMNESGGDLITNGGTTNSYGVIAGWDSVPDANTYEYRYWNSIPGNPYNSPNYYVTTTGTNSQSGVFNQGQGLHHFQVRAIDAAGNASAWSTQFDVNYDVTAPVAPTLLSPADSVAVKGANLVNDWLDVSDAAYYIYTSYNVDGSGNCINSPIRFTDNYTTSNTNTRNVGTLTFCWEVRAVDAAGNISAPSARWKTIVDNDMPIVSIIGSSVSGNVITPDVSASDASSPLTYLWSTVPEVAISNTSAQEPTFTVNVDGTYNFTLTATDTAGNSVVVPFSFTYTTPAAPPVDDENEEETPPPAVQGATTTPPPAPTTAFTNVTTTNNNNEAQEVPVTEAGNTEQETSGVVEGTTTENFANTADDAVKTAAVVDTNNFLGLGWWWLAVLAAIAGLLWFLLGKDKEENEAE